MTKTKSNKFHNNNKHFIQISSKKSKVTTHIKCYPLKTREI